MTKTTKLTGYGVVVNTSLNVHCEPIVCSPDNAYRCSMRTGMDYLVMGQIVSIRRNNPSWPIDTTGGFNSTWTKVPLKPRRIEIMLNLQSTWYVQHPNDLKYIDSDPPYVIKPAIKEHFLYRTKAKAWRAGSRAELEEVYKRASELVGQGEVMVQELISGGGSQQFAYCAFFKQGRAVGSMVVRRARQHPAEFGRSSTYVETVDLPILEDLSLRFLRAIDYYGLVELEYKLDPRDQRYKLLDVNGRTWGYHTLGVGAGVDFPLMLFADQIGQPVEPCSGRAGVKWIRLATDLPLAIMEFCRGRLNLRDYFRTLKGIHVESAFTEDDPLPGLAELALLPYLAVRRGF